MTQSTVGGSRVTWRERTAPRRYVGARGDRVVMVTGQLNLDGLGLIGQAQQAIPGVTSQPLT